MIKWIADHFQQIQVGLLLFFAGLVVITLRKQQPKSNFKVREADRAFKPGNSNVDLANAKLRRRGPPPGPSGPPLSLPGINLSGAPHEILGVSEDASEEEVMKAYKEIIKRYHPDRIQHLPTNQMEFYKTAATAINQAKETLIKRWR